MKHENEPCDELSAISELAIDDVILADRMDSADVILLCGE